jgi:hypothetical protein
MDFGRACPHQCKPGVDKKKGAADRDAPGDARTVQSGSGKLRLAGSARLRRGF